MPRPGVLPASLLILLVAVVWTEGAERAGEAPPVTVFEMPLPGGIAAAMRAADDGTAPDRGHFLLEVIRRTWNTPPNPHGSAPDAVRDRILQHLDLQHRLAGAPVETVPVPLPPELWIGAIFEGRSSAATLAADILRSRGASLLYHGLLSLDDGTRAWFGERPALLAEIARSTPAAFAAAAPGLRVRDGAVRVPGGPEAEPAWAAAVGRAPSEPVPFIRALLIASEGRLAYLYGALSQLSPPQVAFGLRLADVQQARSDAVRRLGSLLDRLSPAWRLEERAFWRPALDPVLLLRELVTDGEGRPVLRGSREFWTAAFGGSRRAGRTGPDREGVAGEPADFVWIAEQVFHEPIDQDVRYASVLFASRMMPAATGRAGDAAARAVRAVRTYPALVALLERAQVRDAEVFAAAAARAATLSDIRSGDRQARALAQFQGVLALLARATFRGSLEPAAFAQLASSLAAVPLNERGEYEGRLVRWFADVVRTAGPAGALLRPESPEDADSLDDRLLRLVAGPSTPQPVLVEWEGTRYRVDFAAPEVTRLERLLDGGARSALSLAQALVALADALRDDRGLLSLAPHLQRIDGLAGPPGAAGAWHGGASAPVRRALETVRRLGRPDPVARPDGLRGVLLAGADDLLARALVELTYAAALGDPRRVAISAVEAAARHEFGPRGSSTRLARMWQFPTRDGGAGRDWYLTGSLLGLDLRLAEFSLIDVSGKPPSRRPMLNEQDRRAMIEAVALLQPGTLRSGDGARIAAALRSGRERVAAVRTPADLHAIADAVDLGPARRTLLSWIAAHDPARLAPFFAPAELLHLGLDGTPPASLDGWGAPARPRLGCDCVQLPRSRAWEAVAGRWHTGMQAACFADLNLRLAELLDGLGMPVPLLAAVLAPATLDFVNTAWSRDPDDRRGPLEFVQTLQAEAVEQYLALFTIDGPLVPVDEENGDRRGAAGGGGPR